MTLSISHLEAASESKKLKGSITEIVAILLAAVNDWPRPIINLEDCEKEIYSLLGSNVVDKSILEKYLSQIDHSKFAWEAESLSQFLEIFNYYPEGTLLKEVIKDIQARV
jgi:hypothetical protein